MKHQERVVICNLKLIDFLNNSNTYFPKKMTFSVEKCIRDTGSFKPFACLDVIIIHILFAVICHILINLTNSYWLMQVLY